MIDYPSDYPSDPARDEALRELHTVADRPHENGCQGFDVDDVIDWWDDGRKVGRAEARANPAPQEPPTDATRLVDGLRSLSARWLNEPESKTIAGGARRMALRMCSSDIGVLVESVRAPAEPCTECMCSRWPNGGRMGCTEAYGWPTTSADKPPATDAQYEGHYKAHHMPRNPSPAPKTTRRP